MSPKDHKFNWVDALDECSLSRQYVLLEDDAEELVETRNSQRVGKGDAVTLKFSGSSDGNDLFEVLRTPVGNAYGTTKQRSFRLDVDRIRVRGFGIRKPADITLTLSDEGDCRFKIDGEGCYLRWQVLRRFLEPLFYPQISD